MGRLCYLSCGSPYSSRANLCGTWRLTNSIKQINLNPENLAAIITEIALDSAKRLAMAISARALAKNGAAQQVADMCLEVANGQ